MKDTNIKIKEAQWMSNFINTTTTKQQLFTCTIIALQNTKEKEKTLKAKRYNSKPTIIWQFDHRPHIAC